MSSEKISKRCAVVLEIAREAMDVLTQNRRIGSCVARIPTGVAIEHKVIDNQTGERNSTYCVHFFLPRQELTVILFVLMKVWDDTSITPKILEIEVDRMDKKSHIIIGEGESRMQRMIKFSGDNINNFDVTRDDNQFLASILNMNKLYGLKAICQPDGIEAIVSRKYDFAIMKRPHSSCCDIAIHSDYATALRANDKFKWMISHDEVSWFTFTSSNPIQLKNSVEFDAVDEMKKVYDCEIELVCEP
jgi:hypothetical protein